jgi:hypothetical protein
MVSQQSTQARKKLRFPVKKETLDAYFVPGSIEFFCIWMGSPSVAVIEKVYM